MVLIPQTGKQSHYRGHFSRKHPAQPAIDFNQDGFVEWGGSDSRVGSWGWQDRFENGLETIPVTPGISEQTAYAWLPRDNIQSFSVGVMAEPSPFGTLLRVGNQSLPTGVMTMSKCYVTLNSSNYMR